MVTFWPPWTSERLERKLQIFDDNQRRLNVGAKNWLKLQKSLDFFFDIYKLDIYKFNFSWVRNDGVDGAAVGGGEDNDKS